MIWVLRLFGYPVLTFGAESVVDESEDLTPIGNTGGYFELAENEAEDEYEEDRGFGFGKP